MANLSVKVDDSKAQAGLSKMSEGIKAAEIGVLVGPTVRYGRIQEARRGFLAASLGAASTLKQNLVVAIPEGRAPVMAAMYGAARAVGRAASGRAPHVSGALAGSMKVIGRRGGGRR
jgi:hypothetical protein